MENNILGGLTGLPPNIPANYFAIQEPLQKQKAILNNDPLSVNKNTSAWKTYILKEDIIWGVLSPSGKPNILFKKGDKVSGVPYETFMMKRIMGIDAKPTVQGAHVETPNGMGFIPLTSLIEVTGGSTNEPTTPNSNSISVDKNQLLQYAVIGLIIYIVFIK